jgi:predicted dehydrogenase
MNILFFGLGSIGQRHLRNINTLFPKYNFFAYRRKFKTPLLNNLNKPISGRETLYNKYKITYVESLSSLVKNKKIDAAFICTPTSYHLKELLWCLKNNIHAFVEKPISSNLKKIHLLKKLIKNKKNILVSIGYQMRFNPLINFIKNNLVKKKYLGEIFMVTVHNGEHISDYHSYENYKDSYTSKKHLGGGVVLTQIHEIDYLKYIFYKFKFLKTASLCTTSSNLKLDVEDVYASTVILKNKNKKILINLTCNFFERPKSRTVKFICEKGTLYADLNNNSIKIFIKNKVIVKKFKFKRNFLFLKEIKKFFSLIKNKGITKKNNLDLDKEISTIKFAEEIKKNFF